MFATAIELNGETLPICLYVYMPICPSVRLLASQRFWCFCFLFFFYFFQLFWWLLLAFPAIVFMAIHFVIY